MPLCRHCHQHEAWRPRGLCWSCWRNTTIRGLYPPRANQYELLDTDRGDITEPELDALIARQLLCLPEWFALDTLKMRSRDGHGGWVVPLIRVPRNRVRVAE